MKQLLPYIFSLVCLNALGQSDSLVVDSLPSEEPVKRRFLQPSLNLDYGKLVSTIAGQDEKYEGGVSFLFYEHLLLTAEYGTGLLTPESAFKNGTYRSEGTYFRIGGGYVDQISAKSRLGLGAYYASGKFQHSGQLKITSNSGVQDDYSRSFATDNLSARWMELFLTSENKIQFNKADPEAKINQLFALGFYLRLRIMSAYDDDEPFNVYSIPGFGKTLTNTVTAVNLYLKFYPY